MQTRTCARCSSWFAEDQIDGEFAGMCPRCLASVLQESHAGVSELKISTVGGPAGPSAPVQPLLPGERFGGYEILGVLGQGGMGVVYKARQTSLDRTVALKVLAPRIAGSAEFARRFDHEAKVLASVNHPNVVQVHDYGREGDVHFLVMEYVDGESLEDAFRRGQAEPAWILRILRDVARGLGRVHEVGIVHRDLKPANILITRDGTAKIGDFGLAVESEGVQRLTERGYFVGTPHYVSPEHAKGEKVDRRSDLYAVGVMLFEGFSGRPPFQAPSPTAVLVKHIEEPAPPLPNAPPDVQKLVRSLLRKDPAERPASAVELESSLDRARMAPPASPLQAGRIGLAAALAALSLALGVWVAFRSSDPPASALPWVLAASDALRAGDVDAARRAVDAGLRSGDPTWAAQLGTFAARIAAVEKDRPVRRDDEEYGAYLCFSKGDWEQGLPLIAAGDASPWREIARQELSTSPDAKEVAEAWLAAAAKSEKPRWAEKMRERAWAWFSAAGARDRLAELDRILECRREIDLLALANPEKFAVEGEFRVEKGSLRTPPAIPAARMALPYLPPDHYDLELTVERRTGQGVFYLGGSGYRLEISGNPRKILVSVRRGNVTATADDLDVLPQTPVDRWRTPEPRLLVVGSDASAFVVSRMMLRGTPALLPDRKSPKNSGWTDLLSGIKVRSETVSGTWTLRDGKLESDGTERSKIRIPAAVPAEYDFRVTFSRIQGIGDVNLILSKGGRSFALCLGGMGNTKSGFGSIRGIWAPERGNPSQVDLAVEPGVVYEARVEVRNGGVRAFLNGAKVCEWTTDYSDLTLQGPWSLHDDRSLGLGTFSSPTRFQKVELREVSRGRNIDPPADPGQQDLIARIDPARDAVKGAFAKEGGSLITPRGTVFSRIMIPVEAPEEYEVTLEAARRSGGDMLGLGILQNGRQVMAVVGGQSGETGGLEMLDGLNFMLNKTRFEHPFLDIGKVFLMKVTVRKFGIEVALDGKRVVAWEGDSKALSLYHEWRVPDRTRMFLASQGSSFEVRRLTLNRLAVPGSETIDLLRWIELPRDAVVGRFQRTDEGILTPWDTPWARIQVPVAPPSEYDLTLQVERKRGGDSLNLGPIWNGRPCTLMIDAAGPEAGQKDVAAMDMLDGKEFFRNVTTTKGPFLLVGKNSVVVVSVRKESIALVIDGRRIFEVKGSDRARIVDGWKLPNPDALMVASYGNAEFLIRSIELRPVSGVPRRLPALNAEPVDLLKQIELDRDVVSGGWKRSGDAIQSSGVDFFSRVMIPVEPPAEYDVEVEVVRKGGRDDFYMGLVQDKTQFGVMLDAGHSTYSAIQAKIGELGKFEGAVFQDERPSTVLYRVRANGLDVRVDGRTILSYVGSLDRGSMFPQWGVPNKKVLFLGAHNSLYVIRRVKLIPLAPVRAAR